MSHYFGGAVVTIECPHCGTRMSDTVDHLGANAAVQCFECGSRLKVDGQQLKAALGQLAAAVNARMAERVRHDPRLEFLPVLVTH